MSWRRLKGAVDLAWYHATGRRPWSRGYGVHRAREWGRALASGGLPAGELPKGYGLRLDERIIEYPWLISRLPAGPGRLLDAGSVLNHALLLNLQVLREKWVVISTLAPEPVSHTGLGVSYLYEDLRRSCLRNDWFDWVVCLSTIEHIGMDNTLLYTTDPTKDESDPRAYLTAVCELARVLRPGGSLYLSMPFGIARAHGWFQVFDAHMVDDTIAAFGGRHVNEELFRYAPDGWRRATRSECEDATYFDVHRASGYDPDFAAASRAVVCLELVK